MKTVEELDLEAQQLREQLNQTEAQKQQAQIEFLQSEHTRKSNLLDQYQNEANSFRFEAAHAKSVESRKELYLFARQADMKANEIRNEMGLPLIELEPDETVEDERLNIHRQINGLLIKAIICLIVFLFSDFTSARIENGFFTYALTQIGRIAYAFSAIFGGCYFACALLFRFIQNYTFSNLKTDFREINSNVRIAVLAGLLAALLFFLSNVLPNAI